MILAIESIKYQHGSQFYRDLCNEFQRILDHREELATAEDSALVAKTVAFYADNTAPAISKIIEKHTGLKSRPIIAKTPNAMFATVLLLPNDEYQMYDIMNRITGMEVQKDYYVNRYGRKKPLTAEELLENAEKLVLDTGKLATDIKVDGSGYKTIIFSDPYCGILAPETVHDKTERYTAEELAAIMLHEVGHNLTIIERMGDTYYRINALQGLLDGFKERSAIDEQAKAAKLIAAKYKNEDVDYTKIDKILDKYEREYEATTGKEWSDRTGFLKVCITVMNTALWFAVYPIMSVITSTMMMNARLAVRSATTKLGNIGTTKKLGDVVTTSAQATLLERWADDYAARHGAGGALVTALVKFNAIFAVLKGGRDSSVLRKSSVYYHTCMMMTTMLQVTNQFGPTITYKRDLDRYNDIAKTTLGMLRSELDSPELRQLYMEQFETTRRHMERSIDNKTIVRYASAIASFIEAALTCDWDSSFHRRYESMLNDIDEMQHTPLYYYAAKFQELSGKNIS